MIFSDNFGSGEDLIGTVVFREISENYVHALTISNSSFLRNTASKGSAFYSSLCV